MIRRKDNKNRVLKEGEYQRTNGTFEYKWRDRWGKRHSIYAKTLEELRKKESEVLRDILDGIRTNENDLIVNDLYYRWAQLKRGLKTNSFQTYKYIYNQYVESSFGKTRIIDLKRSDVRAFYNHLADSLCLKYNTIHSIHIVLHQVLKFGVDDDYLRYNPADNALNELKKVRGSDTEKKKALTISEQKAFENYISRKNRYRRWYPIFTVMLYTGMRVGEVTGLCWEDINFKKGTITVRRTLVYYDKGNGNGCEFAINTPKTKTGERVIPMLPKVKEAFIEEKERQEELNLSCESVIDGQTGFVFINQYGRVHNQIILNKVIRNIIKNCNKEVGSDVLPMFSNHTFRHTFTTRMCEAGVNIKVMQDILGHADAETTLQIYADATEEMKQTELINFEDYLTTNLRQFTTICKDL